MEGITCSWWRHGVVDFLSTHAPDARDLDATGCGLLFLASLHDGLGHAWSAIVRTGGLTLAVTYGALTGADAGHVYPAFIQALAPWVDPAGRRVRPAHGHPWRAGSVTGGRAR